MCVVGSDYDKLKKYNLAELRDNTIPKDQKELPDIDRNGKTTQPTAS